jgi:hydrogenase expression/formation protein HypC
MCLGVPGRLVSVADEDGVRMGRVDFGGVVRKVCLEHVPAAAPGEYLLVHVGFALTRLDEEEAHRVFALLTELGQLEEVGDP